MSTVIKSAANRSLHKVAFNFEDMNVKAGEYLDQVRRQAGQIIVDAQKEAAIIREKAEAEGRQAAMRAVERVLDEKVGKKMETLLPALRQVSLEIADAKQAWLRQWEQGAVRLAVAIAEKVMRAKLPRMPGTPLALVREALEMAAGTTSLRIHLNPTDHESLGGQVTCLAQELRRAAVVEVVADAAVTLGGCRIEMAHGTIDQQFESQLARISAELTQSADE